MTGLGRITQVGISELLASNMMNGGKPDEVELQSVRLAKPIVRTMAKDVGYIEEIIQVKIVSIIIEAQKMFFFKF